MSSYRTDCMFRIVLTIYLNKFSINHQSIQRFINVNCFCIGQDIGFPPGVVDKLQRKPIYHTISFSVLTISCLY